MTKFVAKMAEKGSKAVEVEAKAISEMVIGPPMVLTLDDNTQFRPDRATLSTMPRAPEVGDYVVILPNGDINLSPKDVFETDYRFLTSPKAVAGTTQPSSATASKPANPVNAGTQSTSGSATSSTPSVPNPSATGPASLATATSEASDKGKPAV